MGTVDVDLSLDGDGDEDTAGSLGLDPNLMDYSQAELASQPASQPDFQRPSRSRSYFPENFSPFRPARSRSRSPPPAAAGGLSRSSSFMEGAGVGAAAAGQELRRSSSGRIPVGWDPHKRMRSIARLADADRRLVTELMLPIYPTKNEAVAHISNGGRVFAIETTTKTFMFAVVSQATMPQFLDLWQTMYDHGELLHMHEVRQPTDKQIFYLDVESDHLLDFGEFIKFIRSCLEHTMGPQLAPAALAAMDRGNITATAFREISADADSSWRNKFKYSYHILVPEVVLGIKANVVRFWAKFKTVVESRMSPMCLNANGTNIIDFKATENVCLRLPGSCKTSEGAPSILKIVGTFRVFYFLTVRELPIMSTTWVWDGIGDGFGDDIRSFGSEFFVVNPEIAASVLAKHADGLNSVKELMEACNLRISQEVKSNIKGDFYIGVLRTAPGACPINPYDIEHDRIGGSIIINLDIIKFHCFSGNCQSKSKVIQVLCPTHHVQDAFEKTVEKLITAEANTSRPMLSTIGFFKGILTVGQHIFDYCISPKGQVVFTMPKKGPGKKPADHSAADSDPVLREIVPLLGVTLNWEMYLGPGLDLFSKDFFDFSKNFFDYTDPYSLTDLLKSGLVHSDVMRNGPGYMWYRVNRVARYCDAKQLWVQKGSSPEDDSLYTLHVNPGHVLQDLIKQSSFPGSSPLSSFTRMSLAGVTHKPTIKPQPPNILNLYVPHPFTSERRFFPGGLRDHPSVVALNRHILGKWCAGDETVFAYVIALLARTIKLQYMNLSDDDLKPVGKAILLVGDQGCGKSIVFSLIFKRLLGQNLAFSSPERFFGKFNMQTVGKTLVVVDEIESIGPKREALLKAMITEPHLQGEEKFKPVVTYPNTAMYAFTSNVRHICGGSSGQRRFVYLECDPSALQSRGYFTEFCSYFQTDDQLRAVYEHLLYEVPSRSFDWFQANLPRTALQRAYENKVGEHEVLRFMFGMMNGEVPANCAVFGEHDLSRTMRFVTYQRRDIFNAFKLWCKDVQLSSNSSMDTLSQQLLANFRPFISDSEADSRSLRLDLDAIYVTVVRNKVFPSINSSTEDRIHGMCEQACRDAVDAELNLRRFAEQDILDNVPGFGNHARNRNLFVLKRDCLVAYNLYARLHAHYRPEMAPIIVPDDIEAIV